MISICMCASVFKVSQIVLLCINILPKRRVLRPFGQVTLVNEILISKGFCVYIYTVLKLVPPTTDISGRNKI